MDIYADQSLIIFYVLENCKKIFHFTSSHNSLHNNKYE